MFVVCEIRERVNAVSVELHGGVVLSVDEQAAAAYGSAVVQSLGHDVCEDLAAKTLAFVVRMDSESCQQDEGLHWVAACALGESWWEDFERHGRHAPREVGDHIVWVRFFGDHMHLDGGARSEVVCAVPQQPFGLQN